MRHRLPRLGALAFAAVFPISARSAPTAYPFPAGTKADEAAIRAILTDKQRDSGGRNEAANLDWENAFGIRYNDLAKLNAFYRAVVKPLQASADKSTLEIKLHFITKTVAVADTYWHVVGQLDVQTRKRGPDRWGRTTDMFVKSGAKWTEILERVADLRLPYYKHLDTPPAPAAIPDGTLSLYAGTYERADGKGAATVRAAGDYLTIDAGHHGTLKAVPSSASEFTAFDPNDLAEYSYVSFLRGPDGTLQLSMREPWDGAEAKTFMRKK